MISRVGFRTSGISLRSCTEPSYNYKYVHYRASTENEISNHPQRYRSSANVPKPAVNLGTDRLDSSTHPCSVCWILAIQWLWPVLDFTTGGWQGRVQGCQIPVLIALNLECSRYRVEKLFLFELHHFNLLLVHHPPGFEAQMEYYRANKK